MPETKSAQKSAPDVVEARARERPPVEETPSLLSGAPLAAIQPRDLLTLQRHAGNRAVQGMVHPPVRAGVGIQRVGLGEPPIPTELKDVDQLPPDYAGMNDTQKIAAIRAMPGQKSPSVIARAWSMLGDEVGAAKGNTDLFVQCVKINDDILDHGAFEPMRVQFKKDVEQTALNNLAQNRDAVLAEMNRTGVAGVPPGQEPGAEADFAVQDVQKAAPDMERVKNAKAKMRGTVVGVNHVLRGPADNKEVRESPAHFDPANRPDGSKEGAPTWDEVNAQWMRATGVEAAIIRMHPSAAYFMGDAGAGDFSKLKNAADIKAARAEIAKALNDLSAKIDKVVPLIGSDLKFIDFPPIQQALLAGAPGPSGTSWSKPVEKAVAREEISDANVVHLLETLGLGTLAAAFFIFASIATAGGAPAALGAFLFAGGAVVSAGTAAASWDKYGDLAAAHAATVDPELALVTSEQVDEAMIGAILDTVFALVDVWQGVKGAYVGIKGGKAILEAGKVGAEASTKVALRNLAKAGNAKEVVTKAVAELGHEQASRIAGLSYEELAQIVGKESDLGKRLLYLGKVGMPEATAKLLDQVPQLAKLSAAEGDKVLAAALETYGMIGTLKKLGGWAAIKKLPAMEGAAAKGMEAWRAGLVKELEGYVAKESDQMSKAVRTGTEKPTSDVDVQILGGAAAELQGRAEGWLAGRLGTDVKGAKNLLDAEIFIDPLRSHLIDIMKDLDPAVREAISKSMAGKERAMIYGARYKEALKVSEDAAQKVLKEAEDLGITVMKDFEALTPAAQKRASALIDGKMKELAGVTDPSKKAALIEEIAETQARINASHPDAYVGGGVRVWVTGREEDVAKIAEALGLDPADLKAVTAAQHLTAALTETKWLEAALGRLSKPSATGVDDVGKLAKSVTDIGKHGARAANQLGKAGAPNVARLDELFAKLMAFKEMPAEQLAAKLQGGELGQIRSELEGLLGQLRTQTKSAVEGLGAEAKAARIDLAKMAEYSRLVDWQVRYATLIDAAENATAAYINILHNALQAKVKASLPPPEPTSSIAPPPPATPAGAPAPAPAP